MRRRFGFVIMERESTMRKSHKFDDLSEVECSIRGCTNKIKTRLVEAEDTDHPICYRCYKAIRSDNVSDQDARRGYPRNRREHNFF